VLQSRKAWIRLLGEYESWCSCLVVGEALLVLLAVPAMPLVALYATVYVATTHLAALAFGVLLILATAASGWLCKFRWWEQPVVRRLAQWESWDPSRGEVAVSIAEDDVPAACRAIRRAHLHPAYWRRQPLPDASSNHHIAVVLPLLMPEVEFDVVTERTRDALRRAGIRACVNDVDVA